MVTTRFAVFLRGINVGGVRITMKDLSAVLVTTHQELSDLVGAYPFTAVDDGIRRQDYVVLAASREVVQAVLAAVPDPSPGELVAAGQKVLYWQVPRGESLKTRIAKELARTRNKDQVTTRNMNTLRKVLAKAAAAD